MVAATDVGGVVPSALLLYQVVAGSLFPLSHVCRAILSFHSCVVPPEFFLFTPPCIPASLFVSQCILFFVYSSLDYFFLGNRAGVVASYIWSSYSLRLALHPWPITAFLYVVAMCIFVW